jgi:hypothetical protein
VFQTDERLKKEREYPQGSMEIHREIHENIQRMKCNTHEDENAIW